MTTNNNNKNEKNKKINKQPKPINKIIEGFEKLEAGNFKSKIKKSNILELDIIGKKFNSMIDNLRKN